MKLHSNVKHLSHRDRSQLVPTTREELSPPNNSAGNRTPYVLALRTLSHWREMQTNQKHVLHEADPEQHRHVAAVGAHQDWALKGEGMKCSNNMQRINGNDVWTEHAHRLGTFSSVNKQTILRRPNEPKVYSIHLIAADSALSWHLWYWPTDASDKFGSTKLESILQFQQRRFSSTILWLVLVDWPIRKMQS